MKKLFYSLYALFFNLSRVFPIKQNRIAFIAPHNGGTEDSLSKMRSYIEKKGGYETVFISTNDLKLDFSGFVPLVKSCLKAAGFFTFKATALARSKYVFLNDNFMPMASLKFRKKEASEILKDRNFQRLFFCLKQIRRNSRRSGTGGCGHRRRIR